MGDITAVVLGGGRGTRLYPLTRNRSKPAVPLAGNYRLIDVPVSNCINSGIDRIYVLTQFNSASLNQHISRTYRFDNFSKGFVEILAAEQTLASSAWFQGTADAVRQAMPHLTDRQSEDVLILSGDHLYRMDYTGFIRHHRKMGADISIAVKPVTAAKAKGFGILQADAEGWITEFREKPKGKALRDIRTDTRALGLSPTQAKKHPYLGSMGIYLFKTDRLREALDLDPEIIDFAKQVIPRALKERRVSAFPHEGYWEDIGTIRSFYDAHMKLLSKDPEFNIFDVDFHLYTHPRFLPGSRVNRGVVEKSILNAGCIIDRASIRHSIIGIRSMIGKGAKIENSIILGADYYDSDKDRVPGVPPLGIGPNAVIKKAIIDTNVHIGKNVVLENRKRLRKYDDPEGNIYVRDGIIVLAKGSVIRDGTKF
ncbi:MAG: glucose-1-phosphate adenylyltransferase [Candidatus Krumholzibacteriota bacterium]|nr:glucose-1-phosphate adenylyltransferase [Candidatus Krumholzibacteriota bacterium]